jgi:hypothetical protein
MSHFQKKWRHWYQYSSCTGQLRLPFYRSWGCRGRRVSNSEYPEIHSWPYGALRLAACIELKLVHRCQHWEITRYYAVQERIRRLGWEEECMEWVERWEKRTSVPRAKLRGRLSNNHIFCVVTVLCTGKYLPTFKMIVIPSSPWPSRYRSCINAILNFETSVNIYQSTRSCNTKYLNLRHHCEKPKCLANRDLLKIPRTVMELCEHIKEQYKTECYINI